MKKLIPAIGLTLALLLSAYYIQAAEVTTITTQTSTDKKNEMPPVQWTASYNEPIKIENGTGASLVIQITVFGNEQSPGIKLENCGTTTFIKAGSSAICKTKDAVNPVMFTSDSAMDVAKGSYQITE